MNSYPPELLAQLAPVMFVAGLDAPTSNEPPSSSSPSPATPPPPTPTKSSDPFTVLVLRLREALGVQRKVAIYQPPPEASARKPASQFQIQLVSRDVRFPPRKLLHPDDPAYANAHSPLSPLTPTSPLYPDGLIAPIWIRKHTTLVPSVFVLFLRLYEHPSTQPQSPLDLAHVHETERERHEEERRHDAELSADISQRKKSTNERGIKLTVVLLASRRMLDDPTLDSRLTYIRRTSGLDSRAALFVLSPVSPGELQDFVKSLQQALYEPSLEYYTNHSKRVRRKRNRHASQAPIPISPLATSTHVMRPLRPEGWTVRYEYKMACFAEFRGEGEVALKHYQDAYSTLIIMFGSPLILPPRTKRWAEAKVLADCINVKIVKLYLYNSEHALALSHHSSHIRQFGDFSRGWGIGEDTFEYWSWIARQHRIFAELLEHGTRANLRIPVHRPSFPLQQPAGLEPMVRTLGINPSSALQHPGFYYYVAARCTELRRERFLDTLGALSPSSAAGPGFANEKKVEHLVIILELYTKAYELFKKYTPASATQPGRQTLFIAYRIAQTYQTSGKFDMAVRFFERIAKTYRREQWGEMLRPLLTTWYDCAKLLGDMEMSVRLLMEMLAHGLQGEEDEALEDVLLAVLQSTVPSSTEPVVIDAADAEPLLKPSVVFWASEVKVGEPAAFQISLTASPTASIASLPFTNLEIHFSQDAAHPPLIVRHADDVQPSMHVDVGRLVPGEARETMANLRWEIGATVVLSGTMASDTPASLTISRLVLTMKESSWTVQLPLELSTKASSTTQAKWLSSIEPLRYLPVERENTTSVAVRHRPHSLSVRIEQHEPAYIDEDYPVVIDVTNTFDRALEVTLDVLLQPAEIDDAVNTISVDGQESTSLVKGITCGVLAPGVSVVKTLHLLSTGAPGDRILDVSTQSRDVPDEDEEPVEEEENAEGVADTRQRTELLHTLVVPTVNPIRASWDVAYERSSTANARPGLADLRTFDGDFWDDSEGGEAVVQLVLECAGPWNLEILAMRLIREDNQQAKIVETSTDVVSEDMFPGEYLAGDEICDICRVSLAPSDKYHVEGLSIPGPGHYEVKWRRISASGEKGPESTAIFRLPDLRPPTDGLIALLDAPAAAQLHQPTTMTLTVRNNHPTRAANVLVTLEPDAADAFVVAGVRGARLPVLLPGGEERVRWRVIPIACGLVRAPRVRVVDKRRVVAAQAEGEVPGEGEPIRVVDVRCGGRTEDAGEKVVEPVDEDQWPSVRVSP
ncbi:Gryzun, putative trafficking through golgi-domain-containing protein [Schizophyllum amplum]|uniref:Gryzun, putative trafficking through golgi-domain-containing protein n=1 Tax=Schizophyllum amplum TaxID=97359 RepID=A0A550CW81_9AGAR|nr:Gryzun, putative trafficking through golgi-domain-containing protein [Auriculariopsis ampla]